MFRGGGGGGGVSVCVCVEGGESADAKDRSELWMLKCHQHLEEDEYQLLAVN